jgi:hypothetical protein
MHPNLNSTAVKTAIPLRFVEQRERVLRILRRWERTLAISTLGYNDAT